MARRNALALGHRKSAPRDARGDDALADDDAYEPYVRPSSPPSACHTITLWPSSAANTEGWQREAMR